MSTVLQDPDFVTTIGEFFAAGGLLMWPILGCSVVVVGLAIERYLSLRRARVVSAAVEDAVRQIVAGGEELVEDRLDRSVPAARVLLAGLRRRGCLLADVEKAMEDRLHLETARLRGNVRGITLVAAVAPLLGLLGTVLGIADAFATVEQTGLGSGDNSEALAAGIKVALYTTIFGLFVAIPATLVAAHLHARARRLGAVIAETVAPAIEALARPAGDGVAPPPDAADGAVHAA